MYAFKILTDIVSQLWLITYFALQGIDQLPPVVLGLIRQAINMPEVAEAALSYILFILGGLLIVGGIMYVIKNSYSKNNKLTAETNGHSKVCFKEKIFIIVSIHKSKNWNQDDLLSLFLYKGGEIEKPTNGLNGQLKHQYTNSVEMEDKEIISQEKP